MINKITEVTIALFLISLSFPVSAWKYTDISAERECLAKNIYFEARNQPRQGQIAVGLVTINRVKSKRYPNSICDVVWQQSISSRSGKKVAQFSWTLDGKSDNPYNYKLYLELLDLAKQLTKNRTLDNVKDFTYGAKYYHADYVTPYWVGEDTKPIKVVGRHKFYK